ncbi:DegV family protein [Kyrpidia sp.]|uniref:DegV family protein n=1 Tax=Kyrpidia sp. TaxID=2073077 RepID=UPI00258342C6|nr:DegV family protein [Kyrpidia sp.]MCL6574956.1 DegV family protein [Kyrpidia sp.]
MVRVVMGGVHGQKPSFAVVVDSTAGIPEDRVQALGLTVVPLTVIIGDKAYREGVDLATREFYARLKQGAPPPTTSQPPVGEFVDVFSRLLEEYTGVVCIVLSSALSGTAQAARTAASQVSGPVAVVDSRFASYGMEVLAVEALKMAKAGRSPQECAKRLETLAGQLRAYFVVDDLNYLHRSGRLGAAQALMGTMLQVKPILTLEEGRLAVAEKVRTHRRAVERILERVEEAVAEGPQNICVIHSDREADAEALRQRVEGMAAEQPVPVRELGPVLGAHVGPGVLALLHYPAQG